MVHKLTLSAAFAACLLFTNGCNDTRSSDYPDHSPTTTRQVNDIKLNARDQKDAVDKEDELAIIKQEFKEKQIHDKYNADRAALANATSTESTDWEAKRRGIEIQAKHDNDVIDAEVADKVKVALPEQVEAIRADGLKRKAEVNSQVATKMAPITSEMERSQAKTNQRMIEITLNEAKEMSALEKERAMARDQSRAKKIAIDRWTTDELAKVVKQ